MNSKLTPEQSFNKRRLNFYKQIQEAEAFDEGQLNQDQAEFGSFFKNKITRVKNPEHLEVVEHSVAPSKLSNTLKSHTDKDVLSNYPRKKSLDEFFEERKSVPPSLMKEISNKMKSMGDRKDDIGEAYSKIQDNFGDLDKLPGTLEGIINMKDTPSPMRTSILDRREVSSLLENCPIDYSVVKKNFFYIDEKHDIDYYKDMSPYSRKVFRDPQLDEISLEIFNDKDFQLKQRLSDLTNEDILNVVNNFISESMLKSILFSKNDELRLVDMQSTFLKNQLTYLQGENSTLKNLPAQKKKKRLPQESQTTTDFKIDRKQILSESKIKPLLSTILRLRELKEPVLAMPETTNYVAQFRRQLNIQIASKVGELAGCISSRPFDSLASFVNYTRLNLEQFKGVKVEGVSKLEIVKVLFTEITRFKKEMNLDLNKGVDLEAVFLQGLNIQFIKDGETNSQHIQTQSMFL